MAASTFPSAHRAENSIHHGAGEEACQRRKPLQLGEPSPGASAYEPAIPQIQKELDGTRGTGLSYQESDCQICPPFPNSGSPQLLPPTRTVLSTGRHRAEHSWGLPGALPCPSGSTHLNNCPGYRMFHRHMTPEAPGAGT